MGPIGSRVQGPDLAGEVLVRGAASLALTPVLSLFRVDSPRFRQSTGVST